MIEVYYYIPDNKVDETVECGLKLSEWYDKEVAICGESVKCISALLNPRDDYNKYKSEDSTCIKFELPEKYCFVADKYLYNIGKDSTKAMELYLKSIIPVHEYKFGMYRMPECLVTSTILSDQISVAEGKLDSPILYVSSEELYVNNVIEMSREEDSSFNDTLLYLFYCKLNELGRFEKIENECTGLAVFIDKITGKNYMIKIPKFNI